MTVGHRPRVGRAFRRIALLGATALLFALLPGGVAFAEHFENTEVLDADNAVEAAVNWSQFTFDAATDVALGRNDKFPDNLASSVIQSTDTPLLYTDGDSLSEETRDELERLGAETIHVLGGEEAISEDVVDELESLGYETHRDAGETRIETALDIAATHAADATHGLVVRAFGDDQGDETRAWADALAAGGWAAEEGWPVFLTQSGELNDNVRAYLEDSAIESLTIIGGVNAVSAAVQAELEAMGIEVDRVSGSNRFATAVAIAEARGFSDAGDTDEVILSEGQQSDAWAGGFAAAAYSAISGAPIVLSNGANIPPETEEFLEGAGADGTVALVCGPFVEPAACAEAAEILGHEHAAHGNEDLALGTDEASTNTVSTATGTTNANRGQRQYSVDGLDNTKKYDIVLVPAENVTNTDGTYTFRDAESSNAGNDVADWSATAGRIEVVNGAAQTDDNGMVLDVSPVNGVITFSIDAETADQVVPVIIESETGSTEGTPDIDLNAANEPTENFGVGGQKNWVAPEAGAGSIGLADETVNNVDKENNNFSTNNATPADATDDITYFYDANDIFRMATTNDGPCNPVSMATFEANLSRFDELDASSSYGTDPEAVSTFCLEDINPGAPATVTTQAIDQDTIRVTWTEVTGADAYNIYRVQDTTPGACSATLTDYTQIATVAGTATRTYDDNGLASSTGYCYAVTAVQDGDESGIGGTSGATTAAPGSTVAPRSDDAYVLTDTNGQMNSGDAFRVVFNEQMRPANDNDRIQLRDAQGEIANLYCEDGVADDAGLSEATCAFNTSETTIAGTVYGPGRVLTVTLLEAAPAENTVTGGNAVLDYPVTVIGQGNPDPSDKGFVDVDNNAWDIANSTDVIIDDEGVKTTTQAETVAPTMVAGAVIESPTSVLVTFSEEVEPFGGTYAPGQFAWDDDPISEAGQVAATAVSQVSATQLRITFPAATVTGDADDVIRYNDDIPAYADSGDVTDVNGNQLADNATATTA